MPSNHALAAFIYVAAGIASVGVASTMRGWDSWRSMLACLLAALSYESQAMDIYISSDGAFGILLVTLFVLLVAMLNLGWRFGQMTVSREELSALCTRAPRTRVAESVMQIVIAAALLMGVGLSAFVPGSMEWRQEYRFINVVRSTALGVLVCLACLRLLTSCPNRQRLARSAAACSLLLALGGMGALTFCGVEASKYYLEIGPMQIYWPQTMSAILMLVCLGMRCSSSFHGRYGAAACAVVWTLIMALSGKQPMLILFWLVLCILHAHTEKDHAVRRWAPLALMVAGLMWFVLTHDGYRARLVAFLNPSLDPWGLGYAYRALRESHGIGGLLGVGFDWWRLGRDGTLVYVNTSTWLTKAMVTNGLAGLAVAAASGLLLVRGAVCLARDAAGRGQAGAGASLCMAVYLSVRVVLAIGIEAGLLPITSVYLPFTATSMLVCDFMCLGFLAGLSALGVDGDERDHALEGAASS